MNSRHKIILSLLLTLAVAMSGRADQRVAISLFDLGKLYDTIPSPFHEDGSYTPKGKYRWTGAKYRAEVERVTAVIDSMHMPIVALFGVESEQVVRDIVMCSQEDYCYIHRELDYYDGLDFALLFYGDKLFVDEGGVRSNNTWLNIRGEIHGKSIDIHLSRRGDRLREITPTAEITLLMGRVTRDEIERFGMEDILRERERKGEGDTRGERGWILNSRIGVISDVEIVQSGIYINRWLVRPQLYKPHLPSFVVFDIEK